MADAEVLSTMDRARTPLLRLTAALLLGLLASPAVWAADGTSTAAAPIAIPFEHSVGETYGLEITREARVDGATRSLERHELAVTVRSPLGDGWLVDMRHQALIKNGVRIDLAERTETNAALLDELGGGILRLRVDERGTAESILNWKQVEAALARTTERLLADRVARHGLEGEALTRARELLEASLARPVIEPLLMADWNIVYAACGVRLRPGAPDVRQVDVPRADGGAAVPATDTRSLTPVRDADGDVAALRFVSDVRFGDGGRVRFGSAEAILTERAVITYDPRTGLIDGERVRTLRRGARTAEEIVRFRETPEPRGAESPRAAGDLPAATGPLADARG
ncbi:MAG: hypothetical protein QNJ98_16705 [Planctomycetota bacterium]|nr:hypothetical protein [Planctomycetota bacterium]